MLHESIKVNSVTVKEREDYRLRVVSHPVVAPVGLYSLNFIQESLKDGEVASSQTYNFFMTKPELASLCEALQNV